MHSSLWLAVSLAPLAIAQRISTSARCGPDFGLTCKGSRYGDCCSQYSYCGSTDAYCGNGCQNGFGTCKGSASSSSSKKLSSTLSIQVSSTSSVKTSSTSSVKTSSSSTLTSSPPTPSSTQKVTTNARCGSTYDASPKGQTCLGSKYGDCCSQYSYCGSTDAYCGKGCQGAFGSCKPVSSSIKSSSSTSRTSSVVSSTVSSSKVSLSSSASSASSSSTDSTSSGVSSVSSSTATSASSMASPSSSSSSSSAVSSAVSSTTPAVSETPSLSGSPSCTATNPVKNGQFLDGLTSWVENYSGAYSHGVAKDTGHDDFSYYKFDSNQLGGAYAQLSQSISIPAGTVVDCYAFAFKFYPGPSGVTHAEFTISIDGQTCGTTFNTGGSVIPWTRFGGRMTLIADATRVTVLVTASGARGSIYGFGLDDISVVPVSGPGLTQCSSAVVPSSTPSPTPSSTLSLDSSSSVSSSTPLSSSASSTSSTISSLTPSPSPSAAACTPVANYVINPQFADGVSPWTEYITLGTKSIAQGGHGDGPYYEFQVLYGGIGSRLAQLVKIPSGTVVKCSGWAKIDLGDGRQHEFEMRIDGKRCASATASMESEWNQMTGTPFTLIGDDHLVELYSIEPETSGVVFGWDDLTVELVSCGGVALSPSLSSSLSASVSSSTSALVSSSSLTVSSSASSTPSPSPTSSSLSSLSVSPSPTSSTTSSSTTPSPSPAPCAPATNGLINGQFSAGLSPWTDSAEGEVASMGITSGDGHGDRIYYAFAADSVTIRESRVVLTQANIRIPSGTYVQCSAWAKLSPTILDAPATWTMTIDDQPCAAFSVVDHSDWQQLRGAVGVTVTGETHTVKIEMSIGATDGIPAAVGLDDVALLYNLGPDAGTCPKQ